MSSVMEVGDIKAKFETFGAVCIDIDGARYRRHA